ncbi:major facilitator super transporter protein [Linnemannia zychae]|nr:major facilitator super transporter protein [Linnemannia zychae]
MWSDFEVESANLLKDYKDPGLDLDSNADVDKDAFQLCKTLKSEKKRLGCWYTLALAEHASFLEMHPSRDTGFVVYGNHERVQKLKAAEEAYSKFLSDATSMLSTALSKYDMSLLTNGSMLMAFAVAGMIFCLLQTRLIADFKLSCREPRQDASVISVPNLSEQSAKKKRTSMTTLITAAFSTNVTGRMTTTRTKTSKRRNKNEVNWTPARLLSLVKSLGASMVFIIFSQRPASSSESRKSLSTPAWKSAFASVLQFLITVVITLTLLWITIYKVELESAYFGAEYINRMHRVMSTISSVGYATLPNTDGVPELVYSGYSLARGCYAGMGSILLLTLCLRFFTIPSESAPFLSSSAAAKATLAGQHPLASKIVADRNRLLFVPWMALGTTTMLMILLSRRHNAAIFAFFGIQLYIYLRWTALVHQKSIPKSNFLLEMKEDISGYDYEEEEEIVNDTTTTNTTTTFRTEHPSQRSMPREFRTVPGLSSIHSCSILLWTLSSFFLLGNSNSIASIDISNAYVGIQSYDIFLTGVLTFVSNWAGPLWWCMAALVLMRWDLEWEMTWAKEDREHELKDKEERGWKTIQGWRRSEKGTLNKRTMRRIWRYKKATSAAAASATDTDMMEYEIESVKKTEGNQTDSSIEQADQIVEGQAVQDSEQGLEGLDPVQSDEPLPLLEGEEGGTFFIEEEQVQNSEDRHTEAFLTKSKNNYTAYSGVCVLQEPRLFKRRMGQIRMMEHLIATSLFFGITLYALSIAAIILRHHLFIWTVFSPKVLYQFAWTVLFQALMQVLIVGGGIWNVVLMSS